MNAMHDLGCASGSGMYNECNLFVIKCDTRVAAAFACIGVNGSGICANNVCKNISIH